MDKQDLSVDEFFGKINSLVQDFYMEGKPSFLLNNDKTRLRSISWDVSYSWKGKNRFKNAFYPHSFKEMLNPESRIKSKHLKQEDPLTKMGSYQASFIDEDNNLLSICLMGCDKITIQPVGTDSENMRYDIRIDEKNNIGWQSTSKTWREVLEVCILRGLQQDCIGGDEFMLLSNEKRKMVLYILHDCEIESDKTRQILKCDLEQNISFKTKKTNKLRAI